MLKVNRINLYFSKSCKKNYLIIFNEFIFYFRFICLGIFSTTLSKPLENSNSSESELLTYFESNTEVDYDVTDLHFEKVNWTTLDMNAIVNKFPNLKNLSVENSRISNVIVPERNNKIKVGYNFKFVCKKLFHIIGTQIMLSTIWKIMFAEKKIENGFKITNFLIS